MWISVVTTQEEGTEQLFFVCFGWMSQVMEEMNTETRAFFYNLL